MFYQKMGMPGGSRASVGSFCAATASVVVALALPAAAQAAWGAIAVDPDTGATGVSYDYSTAAAAKDRARGECGGDGCRIAVWVRSGYAALVRKASGVYVAGAGLTKHRAFVRARHRAHEQSARQVVWIYSG